MTRLEALNRELLKEALANCAREPIHRPGTIQPEGILLAFDEATHHLIELSDNFPMLFGDYAAEALGQPLETYLADPAGGGLGTLNGLGEWRHAVVTRFTLVQGPCASETRDALVYHSDGRCVIELELSRYPGEQLFEQLFVPIRDALWRLDAESDISRYTQTVVDQVRNLTGYDRVMMYRFDLDWDGEVIAESLRPGVKSYLGNRFPASDIPPQARALYTRNLVRLIGDIDAAAVAILGRDAIGPTTALDMTYSGLRSFSPVHLEYLRNMGVRATLTISLIQNNRLWGLIACHHLSPKYIPLRARELDEFIGKTVSLKLTELEHQEKILLQARIQAFLNHLADDIRAGGDIRPILQGHQENLLGLLQAQGCLLCIDGDCQSLGRVPEATAIEELLGWLKSQPESDILQTNQLSAHLPEAAAFSDTVSGIMATPVSRDMASCMLWFRPGTHITSKWAGRPNKQMIHDERGYRLSPRESFDAWIDTHWDQSRPWTALETSSARDIAHSVIELIRHRALESSEENYRLLAENANDLMARVQRNGLCTYISNASLEMLGYTPDELTGKHLQGLLHADDTTAWQAATDSLHQPGDSVSLILRFRHKSGKTVWIESVLKVMRDACTGDDLFINAKDVTQRQIYQLAIEDLHKRNAKVPDKDGEGLVNLDIDGRVVYANERAGAILGRDPRAMVGTSCAASLSLLNSAGEAYRGNECPLLVSMRLNQVRHDRQGAMRDADGRRVNVEYLCTPLIDDTHVTGCIVVFHETRGTTADGQAATTQIILDQAREAVMVTDVEGRITSINRAFTDITGYAPGEALGATPKLLKSGIHTRHFYDALWQTLSNEGRWSGEIWNRRKNGEIYPQAGSISAVLDPSGMVRNYVAVFSDISMAKQAEEQLSHMAYHDMLTDLPNRAGFNEQLAERLSLARQARSKLAVLYLDLDLFKIINETMGHQIGDVYLQAIASRLKLITRKQDLLARWGGDEFTLVTNYADDATEIIDMVQRLRKALAEPLRIDGHEFSPTASIGISLYPDDGDAPNDLIKAADTAMYRVKDTGRNGYEFHTPRLSEIVRRKFDMAADLHRALRNNEFTLYYQPQIEADTGQLVGVEALIRWLHPKRGLLGPAEFLAIAEDLGLINDLGLWVLRHACEQMRRWLDNGVAIPRIAVNVAPAQLDDDLLDVLRGLLAEYRLDPEHLEIEIVEGALERNEMVSHILAGIRQLGLALSVDDFGTGYSSLAHIKHLPVTCFKIDKSFIDGIPDNSQDVAIVQTIASLGNKLSVDVIAEGVETEAQYHLLKTLGLYALQGYFFGRPEPAEFIAERFSQALLARARE